MTEEQKYQGKLYRNKQKKGAAPAPAPAPRANTNTAPNGMAQAAYVEDVAEDRDSWRDAQQRSNGDGKSIAEGPVNVFDFLVDNPTPTASNVSLPATAPAEPSKDTQLVRFDPETNALPATVDKDAMVQDGSGPVPASQFETPAPKARRRKDKDEDKEAKSDKKRKRLHVETDHVMTDAPPVLHSGLTGGMSRLMTGPSVFPPSPDYSGGDAAEPPTSPLKRTKSKHHKSGRTSDASLGNSLMAMIAPGSKPKSSSSPSSKKRTKTKSSSTPSPSSKSKEEEKKKKKKKHNSNGSATKSLEAPKEQKLLEFRPGASSGGGDGDGSAALVVYKPRAEHFLSFVKKGPESTRGCSVNKALKRYHRERSASGAAMDKTMEEKELWRSLRMKRNDRGEIVLFCLD